MKRVFIEKSFFNLKKNISAGLISGLKNLSNRGFIIVVDEDTKIDSVLMSVLKSENISIEKKTKRDTEIDFLITSAQVKNQKAIVIKVGGETKSIESAVRKVIQLSRSAKVSRKTKETSIDIAVELDGEGKSKIKTGIGFFDHMLDQIARHANINLSINVKGDLHVDEHHTVEDTGIALGEAIKNALGNKKGIKRYGFFLPMDETIAECAIDLGGRTYLNFMCKFEREKVGEFPTELTEEFFRGLASGMLANIYLRSKGKNDHHKIESMFKAFAKSLNEACRIDERSKDLLPSTKGLL